MRWYREFLPSAPEELCCFLGLKTVPSTAPFPRELWGQRICALISCYNGSEEQGVAAMRPVRDALPPPLLDGMAMMPFPALQGLFDPLLPSWPAMVLEGRFRQGSSRRGHRRASGAGGADAERAVTDASPSD